MHSLIERGRVFDLLFRAIDVDPLRTELHAPDDPSWDDPLTKEPWACVDDDVARADFVGGFVDFSDFAVDCLELEANQFERAVTSTPSAVDAVLAGNAMHWFDMNVAGPEIARVLESNGILAGLWNVFDNRVDWVAGLERISGSAAIGPRDTFSSWRAETAEAHLQTVPQSPSSVRRSTPSSRMGSEGPPTPSSRRSRRRRECW